MQEMAGNTASPSDSLKKFIESWIVEEEPTSEPSQLDANMNIREKLRDDAPAGTVYMINANDVHYFENNGIPIVTSDNGGFQLVSSQTSDNLCLVKGGVIDNTGVVRLIEGGKEIALDSSDNQERIVNLQIMEAPKSDCMVASKETRKVVIHQNTVLNPRPAQQLDPPSLEDSLSITKELVDKNCSPINLEQLEEHLGFTNPSEDSDDNPDKSPGSKSMPIIDFLGEAALNKPDGNEEDAVKQEVAEEGGPSQEQEVKEEAIDSAKDPDGGVDIKTETKDAKEEDSGPCPEKRNRIFSVDDIIGNSTRKDPNQCNLAQTFIDHEVAFSSLEQLSAIKSEIKPEVPAAEEEPASGIVKVTGSSTVLQVAGELMEITVEMVEGKKIIKVKPLSSSTTIVDVNANYEQPVETEGGDQNDISPEPQATNEQSVEAPAPDPDPVVEDHTPEEPKLEPVMAETPPVIEETFLEPPVVENETFPEEACPTLVENVAFEEPPADNANSADPENADEGPASEPPLQFPEPPEEASEILLPAEEEEQPKAVCCFEQFEELPDFVVEDEVFMEELPAHEVIVSDPLEGLGVMEEIIWEPVTTTEMDAAAALEPIEIRPKIEPETDSKDAASAKTPKLEVQILSPTSTNFEDFASNRVNVYCKGGRKRSTDNDVSDYTVTTKAAKKLYDYDLQVQHDIVSSSKKEEVPKNKKALSVRGGEKTQTKSEQSEVVEKRKRREKVHAKEAKQEAAPPDPLPPEGDEEYVDFKELLRARKMKKLKKLQEAGDAKPPEPPKKLEAPRLSPPPVNSEKTAEKLREECSSSTASSKSAALVPSISELMEENSATASKRKISLADYVNRKRKSMSSNPDIDQPKKPKLDSGEPKPEPCRTLSDLKPSFVIHASDWEDSHSPQPLEVKQEPAMEDFNALIPKPVIDINELTPVETREDRKLQEYRDKVESQLSSLNIQIPKPKPQTSPHSTELVKRFLNNEKLSEKEMEKIRKIISYKRSIQGRKHIRTASESATESSYEVKNSSRIETNPSEVRLHIKRVNSRRKVSFDQASEDHKKAVGYSVINRLGQDGMPKIVFKRHKKSLAKEPVVELVKLNLNNLVSVQEEYNVTVSQNM